MIAEGASRALQFTWTDGASVLAATLSAAVAEDTADLRRVRDAVWRTRRETQNCAEQELELRSRPEVEVSARRPKRERAWARLKLLVRR
jgi:hypothetical protein